MKPMLVFVLGLFGCLSLQAQSIIYVKPSGTGDGTSWDLPLGNIQTAINGARQGDQVWVAKGAYYGLGENEWEFVLRDGVSLYGGFSGTETAIDQRDLNANPTILSGGYSSSNDNTLSGSGISTATVIDGFTLAPFNASAYSRGIYLVNSSPTIKNCIISGNRSYLATSSHNGYGAAAFLEGDSRPAFINCSFSDNKAIDYGGAVYSLNSAPTFTDCRFLNNDAGLGGGGAFNLNSSAKFLNCVFLGNTSLSTSTGRGGGIGFSGGGESRLESCLIAANTSSAAAGGAGVYCNESGLTILNTTITGNVSQNQTGGAALLYAATSSHSPIIINSVIWNNISDRADASLELYEIVGLNNAAVPGGHNNLIRYGQYGSLAADPLFVDPASGNYQLQGSSPAIDAGDNLPILPVEEKMDLAGHPRIINDIIDLGAFETITDKITNNGDASYDGFSGTLNITGNKYDNGLLNTYKWKMIVSSATTDAVLVVDPNDLSPYKTLLDGAGIVFDSTHFIVADLAVLPTLLQIITQTGGWESFDGEIILSRVVYPGQVSADSVISNSETIQIAGALPVELKDFTGVLTGGLARLQWHTGIQTGLDHFELESSSDGKQFTFAAAVNLKQSDGDYKLSIVQRDARAYYRLKILHTDATAFYYPEILSLTQKENGTIKVYPNPATTEFQLNVGAAGQLRLYDLYGRCVLSVKLKQGLNQVFIGQLAKGVYFGEIDQHKDSRFRLLKN